MPGLNYFFDEECRSAYDPDIYTLIGTSTDVADDLPVDFTFGDDEPTILGIPYDANGDPIVELDDDGIGNVAGGFAFNIPVPEPASPALFGTGLAGLWLRRRRRKA